MKAISVSLFFFILLPHAWAQPLPHAVYVWQRSWNVGLVQVLRQQALAFDEIHFLAGQLDANGWHAVAPDAVILAESRPRLVPVFRVDGSRPPNSTLLIANIRAFQQRHALVQLELDYDCPTTHLADYTEFLGRLRQALPGMRLTITVLPDWLRSPMLPALLRQADRSVLQVHGVLPPGQPIFDPKLASRWLGAYAALAPHPFRVALPAYGLRVQKSADGIVVESEQPLGLQLDATRVVVDPAVVAAWLKQQPSLPHLEGYIWFRLPRAGDRAAWSPATLAAVREGRYRSPSPVLRYRPLSASTWDLVLENSGEVDAPLPERLALAINCHPGDGTLWYRLPAASDTQALQRLQVGLLKPHGTLPIGWVHCEGAPRAN